MENAEVNREAFRIPVLCVVGRSDSGKTTLMEGLIKELSKRGHRVATIKRTHHAVELDQPGKDSWRHRKAGATLSIISSRGIVGVFSDVEKELSIEELRDRFIHRVDLILAEGYKDSDYPKMMVVGQKGWDAVKTDSIKVVVSGLPAQAGQRLDLDVPVFRPSDVVKIVTFLEQVLLSHQKI